MTINSIMRGDKVWFETMGAVPIMLEGKVMMYVPAGENIYERDNVLDIFNMAMIKQLPKRRRRFKEVNTRNDRYLVAVHRKGKKGDILNSIDYYAPIAERVKKHE